MSTGHRLDAVIACKGDATNYKLLYNFNLLSVLIVIEGTVYAHDPINHLMFRKASRGSIVAAAAINSIYVYSGLNKYSPPTNNTTFR